MTSIFVVSTIYIYLNEKKSKKTKRRYEQKGKRNFCQDVAKKKLVVKHRKSFNICKNVHESMPKYNKFIMAIYHCTIIKNDQLSKRC